MTDREIELLWEQLEDVTIDDNECIMSDFDRWKAGAPKTEIWSWFNAHHSLGLLYLANDYEGSVCIFGICKAVAFGGDNFDCKECGNTSKKEGFTGCVYSLKKSEYEKLKEGDTNEK